jgi:hypothetical protein
MKSGEMKARLDRDNKLKALAKKGNRGPVK